VGQDIDRRIQSGEVCPRCDRLHDRLTVYDDDLRPEPSALSGKFLDFIGGIWVSSIPGMTLIGIAPDNSPQTLTILGMIKSTFEWSPWSVMAIALQPWTKALLTSSAGISSPSLNIEWVWRSIMGASEIIVFCCISNRICRAIQRIDRVIYTGF